MERSANSQDVANYSILAQYYDELLQDEEALSIWLKYIEEKPFKSVLELASGSGVMAKILKNKGYQIIASDLSSEMKKVAKKNFDGEYLILNMIDYHLEQKFDLILCLCDSINYLQLKDLDCFFKCGKEHLKTNGRLIFDMHSIKRLEEFKQEYIEEGYVLNTPYQWTINEDFQEKQLYEHFTFYTDDGMIQEHHTQNVFEIQEVKEIMEKYFKVKVIENFIEDEKVLLIGEEK